MESTRHKNWIMKTNELTGAALDWAVAKCEVGAEFIGEIDDPHFYSTDWSQGGSIIEREKISLEMKHDGWWVASFQYNYSDEKEHLQLADTPLIAAMRCYVASKLGDNVVVPEELK